MFNNPFVECTARDMEYKDVVTYWCQPYEYYAGLNENALSRNTTPIFIEGARGSGKTMILKHLSYFCQRDEYNRDELLQMFAEHGSLGIYYRFKNDFGKLLAALNCSWTIREEIFEEYFQLYYSRELILIFHDLFNVSAISCADAIICDLNKIFSSQCDSFDGFLIYINNRIEKLDSLIRKLKYIRSISDEVSAVVSGMSLITKIFEVMRYHIPEWNNITLLILVDEYENISAFQKRVNTYVKQTDAETGITYRIGMRPEGIVTYSTFVGGEQLQVGRDFLSMQLRVTNPKKFQRFLKIVAEKRLEKTPFFAANNLTKIEKILGMREDWVNEAQQAIKNRPSIVFECLDYSVSDQYTQETLQKYLSFPSNPLIEMQNVLWINRGKTVEETHAAMTAYLNAKHEKKIKQLEGAGRKYYLDFDMKYKYSLLFALLSKCGIKKKYYSFTTFSYLSCGSVNDFLSLCRNTFMEMDQKSYDTLLKGKSIPAEIQDRGARDAASEQLDKIRLCEDSGTEMYTFVMNIGEVFSLYHRNTTIHFPETNQFAFENEAEVEGRDLLKRNLKYMLKWGVIEKKHNKQRISIGRRKGNLYYLNRLLAPIFGISYRTRGGYNFVITTDVFERMLSNSMDATTIISQNKKKKPGKGNTQDRFAQKEALDGQISLFEGK